MTSNDDKTGNTTHAASLPGAAPAPSLPDVLRLIATFKQPFFKAFADSELLEIDIQGKRFGHDAYTWWGEPSVFYEALVEAALRRLCESRGWTWGVRQVIPGCGCTAQLGTPGRIEDHWADAETAAHALSLAVLDALRAAPAPLAPRQERSTND